MQDITPKLHDSFLVSFPRFLNKHLKNSATSNMIYVNGLPAIKTSSIPNIPHWSISIFYTGRPMSQHWQIIDCTSQLIFLPLLGL
jgi:hypothetical protein